MYLKGKRACAHTPWIGCVFIRYCTSQISNANIHVSSNIHWMLIMTFGCRGMLQPLLK